MSYVINDNLLGGLSHQEFLDEYWQQKPLLIRQAFNGSPVDISPEELAGISCDTDAPSRIIIEHGESPWESLFGPFDDETFASLPESHWTLLVNDLERFIPELRDIIQQFKFIPDWRIDDLMLSYAAKQGSVGPHTDEYDVFLIQTSGKRHWQLDTHIDYPKEILSNCSLSILKKFNSNADWILAPGDMLYLPPNLPHYGIAQDDNCMTLSVGFRAPSQQELINGWIESITEKHQFKQRYSDKKRQLQKHSAEITQHDIEILSNMIVEGIDSQKDNLSLWLGKYLTETKGETRHNSFLSADTTSNNETFIRESWLRLAYTEKSNKLHFFADGEHFPVEDEAKEAIFYLCEHDTYTKSKITNYCKIDSFRKIFESLLEKGGINP
ncbi:MAG: cupin domain-containing protein [Aquificaceae bacterium]|nr:MAG: cupin domain-containing protein [Aquificaceae bacterium]